MEIITLDISADEYIKALKEIREFLEPKNKWSQNRRLELLRTHYYAKNHDVTATELASAVGYKNYNAANLQYGLVGGALITQIYSIIGSKDKERADRVWNFLQKDGTNLTVLVNFVYPRESPDEMFHWIMRPEVAEALEKLRLVNKR